jgi:hypothetical protein
MRVWRSWMVVAVSVALAGCGGHALNVGSNDAGAALDVDTSSASPAPFADASPTATQVWAGHFENHQLPNGSDALTMTLTFAADGSVTGTLLLGDGAVLQPPTDPDVGYPPGTSFAGVTAIEGFPYTILGGTRSGSHLTFHVDEEEAWTKWCALQTSYLVYSDDAGAADDLYECLPQPQSVMEPEGGESEGLVTVSATGCFLYPMTDQMTPIDCGKLELCSAPYFPCQCSATGCQVSPTQIFYVSFDLVMTDTKADGSTSGALGSYTVHFTRIT